MNSTDFFKSCVREEIKSFQDGPDPLLLIADSHPVHQVAGVKEKDPVFEVEQIGKIPGIFIREEGKARPPEVLKRKGDGWLTMGIP